MKPPLPLCCLVHPEGQGVCYRCKQPSCKAHQAPNGLTHTFCNVKKTEEQLIDDLFRHSLSALTLLKETAEDLGSCDHSVGICYCTFYSELDAFERAVKAFEGSPIKEEDVYDRDEWGEQPK